MNIDLAANTDYQSAQQECAAAIDHFAHEATKNQRLAWSAGLANVVASASIPVLIVVSTQSGAFWFGKLLPAVLAAISAVAAGAAQIVRPHERWRSCRQHQLLLEEELLRYVHRLGDYALKDRDRHLVERVISFRHSALDEWRSFVPATPAEESLKAEGPSPAAPK
jgi:hypothetical protein